MYATWRVRMCAWCYGFVCDRWCDGQMVCILGGVFTWWCVCLVVCLLGGVCASRCVCSRCVC